MDYLGKVVAVAITVIAIFIAPVVNLANSNDDIVQSTVYSITTDFVADVRAQGKITQDMYMSFVSQLDNTGILYNIEMQHSYTSPVPEFDDTGKATGIEETENIVYTDDILKSVYETNGVYTMHKGDVFSITVSNREATLGQKMRQIVFKIPDTSSRILVKDGGVIRDENF